MNNKNEKHFSGRLNIQLCELLQVFAEAAIRSCFEKQVKTQTITQSLVKVQVCRLIAGIFTNK